jgi:aldehyde dehydrogenase (NAD+)
MISEMVQSQREYFLTGATRGYEFRAEALRKLKEAIIKNEKELSDALKSDLNRSICEAYSTEIGIVLDEISFHQKHLKKWMRRKSVKTAIGQLPGRCFIAPEPYGVALIMAPWNYPINLCFEPLIGAISGGNCAVVKPSAYAPATSAAIEKLISETFPKEYIAVIEGGRQQNALLLEEKFDYIFFTGSVEVGKVVMASASKHLTPVTLELGGKSPVIVDETANIRLAAKRIAFGKVTNAGQTCVEPDYLFIHESMKNAFVEEFKNALRGFFPDGDMSNMCTIVSEKHYARVKGLMEGEHIILGGGTDDSRRFIEPTLLDGITFESPIMQEEIFGPLLPVMTYKSLDECIKYIQSRPKPLALYLFTESKANRERILSTCSFGGGCINDAMIHIATSYMPFGGVGASGMGGYHGKKSFDTFTHYRSIFSQSTKMDVGVRYMPYSEKRLSLLKKMLK